MVPTRKSVSSVKRRPRWRRDLPRSDFRVLRTLSVRSAIELYQSLYARGRHGHPPSLGSYAWMTERGDRWVVAEIPLDHLIFQTIAESSPERLARAQLYAARGGAFPPGTASYAGRSRARKSGKAYVQDGNHRVLAADLRGDSSIAMLMPEDEYRALVADASER
jgi:hypothetical protein